MATTTNYGWTTPDDTALVKDGAAAIRTLGSSVDTTTKNLNPETTLGDIAYRSSTANVKTRLGLGTAGQVLAVNSGATAPEWVTSSSGGMTLISTTTLTGSSVTLSSIPQTYRNLQLVVQNPRPSIDEVLAMRFNSDATLKYRNNEAFSDAAKAPNNFGIYWSYQASDNGASTGLAITDIYDYTNTSTWKLTRNQAVVNNIATPATQGNLTFMGGIWYDISAISSITLYPDSGNWTSGTAYLYGVK
jgi:hypothetical protein